MSILQSTQLLDQLTTSIDASGWRYLLVQNRSLLDFDFLKMMKVAFLMFAFIFGIVLMVEVLHEQRMSIECNLRV